MASSDATSLQLYLRLLRYVKPYWAPFALSIAAMVVTALTEPVFPALLKPLLDGSFVHKEGGLLLWLPGLIVAVSVVFAWYLSGKPSSSTGCSSLNSLRRVLPVGFSQLILTL